MEDRGQLPLPEPPCIPFLSQRIAREPGCVRVTTPCDFFLAAVAHKVLDPGGVLGSLGPLWVSLYYQAMMLEVKDIRSKTTWLRLGHPNFLSLNLRVQ